MSRKVLRGVGVGPTIGGMRRHRPRRATGLAWALGGLALACARTDERWREDLGDPDPFVRGTAAIALSLQAPRESRAALAELLRAVDREDVGLGEPAARALAAAGPHHVPWLLDQLLEDELMSAERRAAILRALIAAGPDAAEPVLACLRGRGSSLAGDLGDVLLALGPAALPGLVAMLEDEPDVRLRSFAAFLLASMGPRARSALPALRVAAASSDPNLGRMANEAIASLEGRPWRVPMPDEGR